MKTLRKRIRLYRFDQLSPTAQEKAVSNRYYDLDFKVGRLYIRAELEQNTETLYFVSGDQFKKEMDNWESIARPQAGSGTVNILRR